MGMYTLIWFDAKNPHSASNPQQHGIKFRSLEVAIAKGEELWKTGKVSLAYVWNGNRIVWEKK